VSDIILQEYFRQFYPSVRSAKVITDAGTGRSKGYGFVRFRWAGLGARVGSWPLAIVGGLVRFSDGVAPDYAQPVALA